MLVLVESCGGLIDTDMCLDVDCSADHKTDYAAETPHPADYHHSDYNYVPVPGPPVHVAGPPGPNGGFGEWLGCR
jgi:hypothetical protein